MSICHRSRRFVLEALSTGKKKPSSQWKISWTKYTMCMMLLKLDWLTDHLSVSSQVQWLSSVVKKTLPAPFITSTTGLLHPAPWTQVLMRLSSAWPASPWWRIPSTSDTDTTATSRPLVSPCKLSVSSICHGCVCISSRCCSLLLPFFFIFRDTEGPLKLLLI